MSTHTPLGVDNSGKPAGSNSFQRLLVQSLEPIESAGLSDFDKAKARALLTGFHFARFNVPFPKVLEVESTKDWPIPGTDYVFHMRLDLLVDSPDYGRQVVDWKTVTVSKATIEQDDKFSWWLADLAQFYSHDTQPNYYAEAMDVDTVIMFQLVKPPFRPTKKDCPATFYGRCLDFYQSHPSRCFYPLLVVPSCKDEVRSETRDIVNRVSYLKERPLHLGGQPRAIKNRRECKGCPYFSVCSGSFDIADDRAFTDKPQAIPGGKYLSVSQINTFHRCERYWHHQYVDWREPLAKRQSFFEFGGAIHNCLEIWANGINDAQRKAGVA